MSAALDIDEIIAHARRCDAIFAPRFPSVGYRDMWQAYVRTVADHLGVTVGDRDQAAMLVASTLLTAEVSSELGRPGVQASKYRLFRWPPEAAAAGMVPGQLTSALLLPYLEGSTT